MGLDPDHHCNRLIAHAVANPKYHRSIMLQSIDHCPIHTAFFHAPLVPFLSDVVDLLLM